MIAVMINNRKPMEDVEAYQVDKSYDMCEALKGIQEDGITIGLEKGLAKRREAGMEAGVHFNVPSPIR